MNDYHVMLRQRIDPLRQQLTAHPLFHTLRHVPALRVLMAHHVAAVWDFMTLLKSLQRELTCVDIPWLPTQDATARRLINEIVLAEESDRNDDGHPISHFEWYLHAMTSMGCDTSPMLDMIQAISQGVPVPIALAQSALPDSSKAFSQYTWHIASESPLWVKTAVFAFGREELIPDMFTQILLDLQQDHTAVGPFVRYIQRHIALDGDEHGPMALRMVQLACGDDPQKWQDATEAVEQALHCRLALWDGAFQMIQSSPLG